MSKELYRTHTRQPKRGTIWQDRTNGRFYRVTKTKWYGGVGIVYGKAATTADAMADLKDAIRELGVTIWNAIPLTRPRT